MKARQRRRPVPPMRPNVRAYLLKLVCCEGSLDEESRHLGPAESVAFDDALAWLEADPQKAAAAFDSALARK